MKMKNKAEKELGFPIPTYHELTIHMIRGHETLLFNTEDSRDEFFWMADARIGADKPIFYSGMVRTLSYGTEERMMCINPRNILTIEVKKE